MSETDFSDFDSETSTEISEAETEPNFEEEYEMQHDIELHERAVEGCPTCRSQIVFDPNIGDYVMGPHGGLQCCYEYWTYQMTYMCKK